MAARPNALIMNQMVVTRPLELEERETHWLLKIKDLKKKKKCCWKKLKRLRRKYW